jgi:hypothetical protein
MVTEFKNFLSEDLYKEVAEFTTNLVKDKAANITVSLNKWESQLTYNSSPVLRYDLSYQKDNELFRKLKEEAEEKTSFFVRTIMIHIFPKLSNIPWHDDSHTAGALTIYVNEFWDRDWGGYLMYVDKKTKDVKAIKPEKNLGVLQEDKVLHCVTTTNINAKNRISLQFFLEKQKNIL